MVVNISLKNKHLGNLNLLLDVFSVKSFLTFNIKKAKQKSMERRQFLESIGIGAAFVLTTSCLQSCTKDSSSGVDFTLDLSASINIALKTNGGYIVNSGVVVAKDSSGNYVAATQTCTHEGNKQITLKNNEWYCTAHGARFSLSGSGLNSEGSKGLTIYKTALTGTTLRVYS